MIIKKIISGSFMVNTYIISQGNDCIMIDAGGDSNIINSYIKDNGFNLIAILLTHGHCDHIDALNDILSLHMPTIYIEQHDVDMLYDGTKNLSAFIGSIYEVNEKADVIQHNGDEINLIDLDIKIMHTPGHSMGSCIYIINDSAFVGDTLFNMSIGRTDFAGSDYNMMMNSLDKIKKAIPRQTKIYSGHGNDTDMKYELEHNPYL